MVTIQFNYCNEASVIATLQPSPCHYFIRLLQDKGVLLRHYTQVFAMN